MMKMPIVTYTTYWPAKYLGTEDLCVCLDHEAKLYGLSEMKFKKMGIEILTHCGQWDGSTGRTMTVLKVPPEQLTEWIQDYAQRSVIYFQKLVGFDSEYEIWLDDEEMADAFKDEPFWKNQLKHQQELLEKYGKPE